MHHGSKGQAGEAKECLTQLWDVGKGKPVFGGCATMSPSMCDIRERRLPVGRVNVDAAHRGLRFTPRTGKQKPASFQTAGLAEGPD